MSKPFISPLIFAAAVVGLAGGAGYGQAKQGFSGNAATQSPAAQRENYDPLLDLPPLPNNRVTLMGGTVSGLDEVLKGL